MVNPITFYRNQLLPYLSQLEPVAGAVLDKLVSDLEKAKPLLEATFQEPYPEYSSGGMKIVSLLNPTGEQNNFDYTDCQAPRATPLLEALPHLKAFLTKSQLHIMGCRLLKLEPGCFFHEHRDFVYLENIPRYRLHLPLITNPQASIIAPGVKIHFKKGYLWKLDPKQTVHSAINGGKDARYHVLIDCYLNERLVQLLAEQFLDDDCLEPLPLLSEEERKALHTQATSTWQRGNTTQAEEILLSAFCHFDLKALTTYDLIEEFFQSLSSSAKQEALALLQERSTYWQGRYKEVYPEKFLAPVAK
jgi:hypothetical protein